MTELKEYIRKSIEEGQQNQDVSRQERINFFKEKVEDLYRLVNDNLLADLHEEGLYSVSYEDEDIVEEGIGRYTTRSMLMKMGSLNVELRPYGTVVIGARGRVDMWVNDGDESAILILVPTNSDGPQTSVVGTEHEWVWKMVERKVSRVTYLPLTSDMFQKKILSLASLYV